MTTPSSKRKSLGKGLDALFGEPAAEDRSPGVHTAAARPLAETTEIPVASIRAGRFQPRRVFDDEAMAALTQSVREKGVVTPILLRPHPEEVGHYELIAGERRWLAAQRAQLHDIPAIVRPLSDQDALEIALVENVQRQDLTPIEEAQGYQRLLDEFQHTQEALARVVGKSRSHIANTLRLLGLPDAVKRMLDAGDLTAGHARALLTAPDPAALAKRIVARGLSVRDAERLVKRSAGPNGGVRGGVRTGDPSTAAAAKDADTLALERDLGNALGLKVTIDHRGDAGRLILAYRNLEQLDELLDLLRQSLN